MENLGSMADLRYTGFRKVMDRDVLDLQCIDFALDPIGLDFSVNYLLCIIFYKPVVGFLNLHRYIIGT